MSVRWEKEMSLISIYGTPNSKAIELATKLSKSLHFEVGEDKDITVDSLQWYKDPRSYSIFCINTMSSPVDMVKWYESRQQAMSDYEVDLMDMRNYDLVLDTYFYTLDDIMSTVLSCYRNRLQGVIVCGAQCLPTQCAIDTSIDLLRHMEETGETPGRPCVTLKERQWYVIDGHARMYVNPYVPYICQYKITNLEPHPRAVETYETLLNRKFETVNGR